MVKPVSQNAGAIYYQIKIYSAKFRNLISFTDISF
jgi:hypothetical protein